MTEIRKSLEHLDLGFEIWDLRRPKAVFGILRDRAVHGRETERKIG
jgi:hypothetical protein